MKYTLVAVVNLFFGIIQLIFPLIFLLFIIPSLKEIYASFNGAPNTLSTSHLIIAVSLILGSLNIWISIKLFSKSTVLEKREKYVKYGIISAIISFLTLGLLLGSLSITVMSPMYNLSN